MKCNRCGSENPDHQLYCGKCGNILGVACRVCDFPNPPQFIYCGNCGSQLYEIQVRDVKKNQSNRTKHFPHIRPLQKSSESTGEKRTVSVLVMDVARSTNLLEKIGTEKWVTLMHQILQMLEGEIIRFGGIVHQFRGDGLIAFFGAIRAHEDDSERAILAALSCQRTIQVFSSENEAKNGFSISIRAGISTGEVIITKFRNRGVATEEAVGNAVTTALLMESSAEPGTVLVSEDTYLVNQNRFVWLSLAERTNPSKTIKTNVYRPTEPIQEIDKTHINVLPIAFVSREKELGIVVSAIGELTKGKGNIITLVAEKGMGKSILVDEAFTYIERESSLGEKASPGKIQFVPIRLRSRCRSYNQLVPYALWQDILLQWIGVSIDDSEELKINRLSDLCYSLWGDTSNEYYPYLAYLLALPLDENQASRIHYLNPDGLKRQFILTIHHWLSRLSINSPMIIALGEIQWIDSSSFETLVYCLELCQEHPLTWLITYRPEEKTFVHELEHLLHTKYSNHVLEVRLLPLSNEEMDRVIEKSLGRNKLTTHNRSLIIESSEGNPYYVRELLQSLIQKGLLTYDDVDNSWQLIQNITNIELPMSLQALFLSRIDQLSPDKRYILQLASVIGNDFWVKVLEAIAPDSELLYATLDQLTLEQLLIEQEDVPELGKHFVFKSTLLHDVAYDNLLIQQRKDIHRRTAEFLENTLNIEFFLQHFGLIAYHYSQAGIPRKELFYTLQFANQIKRVYANVEALDLYNRALVLIQQLKEESNADVNLQPLLETEFEITKERIGIYELIGQTDGWETDARKLIDLAGQLGPETNWMIDAILLQPGVSYWRSRDECVAGVELLRIGLSLSRRLNDTQNEINCLKALTRQYAYLGNPLWQNTGQQALDLARQIGNIEVEAKLLQMLGSNYSWSNTPDKGFEYLQSAQELAESLDDKILIVDLLNTMGVFIEREGDYCRSLQDYWEKCLKISSEIGYRKGEVTAMTRCGQTQALYLGDSFGGIAWLEAARRKSIDQQELFLIELRMFEILIESNKLYEAQKTLLTLKELGDGNLTYNNRASFLLANARFSNQGGCKAMDYQESLDYSQKITKLMALNPLMSQQYVIAASSIESESYIKLADCADNLHEKNQFLENALAASQNSIQLLSQINFIQIAECTSEDVLFRHAIALQKNNKEEEAARYYQHAHDELLRKYEFIPIGSPFRSTFLEWPRYRNIINTVNKMKL